MAIEESTSDWKLKLRYGKIRTPFKHFTAIADGEVEALVDGFSCPAGPAIMAIKTWSSGPDETADMVVAIGRQIGFSANGKIEIYETEPEQPPGQNPHGYSIHFTPYARG